VVPGWAAGGGHSLHVVCDLTLASREHARFKQTDADVGSFDGGFGSAYLARQVGQKFAREIFFLGDTYDAAAAPVFGRGQVSTYILAGLGDSKEAILATCEKLIALGVYPFVVPFVPISGTPLESHPGPSPSFMHAILAPLASMLLAGGLKSSVTTVWLFSRAPPASMRTTWA